MWEKDTESSTVTRQSIPYRPVSYVTAGLRHCRCRHTCFSTAERWPPNLAHTALIFQMLLEHLNFCTSISGPRPALINGPHLSRHHVARRPCPARQLCFRIMGALHPSPYHAMIVHLCDLSVKPLCQKGQRGTVQVEAIGTRGRGEALRRDIYVQYVTECLVLWLTDKHRNIFSQTTPRLSFCSTWGHGALETFCLPLITLAGKAKPLMVTAGSIHVRSPSPS